MAQYGALEEDIKQKQEYAGYRASLIAQALQSGGQPPPPSGVPGQASGDSPTGGATAVGPGGASEEEAPKKEPEGPVHFEPVQKGGPPNAVWEEPRRELGSTSTIEDYKAQARKQAMYASSALMFQDVKTALMCTNTAIQLLRAAGIQPQ